MAAFDFPNTPNVGDLFQDSTSGAVYRWNGYAWVGGVTGIGLQTVKETRYLVAGSFTHTRDSKSNGLADIHLMGAIGARPASLTWASGQLVCAGGGGGGAITIKWKYPLPASAPVVVGASIANAVAGTSSFDTVLTALGGSLGATSTAASATNQSTGNVAGGVAGTTGDENYGGPGAMGLTVIGGWTIATSGVVVFMRGIMRRGIGGGSSNTASFAAALADPGAVCVVEYLNP